MEKQMHLFIKEKTSGPTLWFLWPEETRLQIENLLAKLTIKFLISSMKEADPHEKRK
jgi:hypothetical protein